MESTVTLSEYNRVRKLMVVFLVVAVLAVASALILLVRGTNSGTPHTRVEFRSLPQCKIALNEADQGFRLAAGSIEANVQGNFQEAQAFNIQMGLLAIQYNKDKVVCLNG